MALAMLQYALAFAWLILAVVLWRWHYGVLACGACVVSGGLQILFA